MKLLSLLVVIVTICVIGTLGYTSHVKTKTENAIWAEKNKDFPDTPQSREQLSQLVEPQALISNTGHILIVDKGGATLMYCVGVYKCQFAYGVSSARMAEAVNEMFISMAAQSRQRAMAQQQAMKQISPAPVPPKAKPDSLKVKPGVHQESHGVNSPNINGAGNVTLTY